MGFDLYQLVQILYWIALSTAFGGALFVAIAAPVVFRTVREAEPVLPSVLSVNLEGQHGTMLAGTIVSNLLVSLGWVQAMCGGVLLLTLVAQFFLADMSGSNLTAMLIRTAMFIAAAVVAAYDRLIVWPRIQRYRQQYIDHADEPEVANPARDQFDREHRRSVNLLGAVLFLLLGMILFSANITPRTRSMPRETAMGAALAERSGAQQPAEPVFRRDNG